MFALLPVSECHCTPRNYPAYVARGRLFIFLGWQRQGIRPVAASVERLAPRRPPVTNRALWTGDNLDILRGGMRMTDLHHDARRPLLLDRFRSKLGYGNSDK